MPPFHRRLSFYPTKQVRTSSIRRSRLEERLQKPLLFVLLCEAEGGGGTGTKNKKQSDRDVGLFADGWAWKSVQVAGRCITIPTCVAAICTSLFAVVTGPPVGAGVAVTPRAVADFLAIVARDGHVMDLRISEHIDLATSGPHMVSARGVEFHLDSVGVVVPEMPLHFRGTG